MYRLEKKEGVFVAYREALEMIFPTLNDLIDYCYKNNLFNEKNIPREKLISEIDVDWYLTDLVTRKI